MEANPGVLQYTLRGQRCNRETSRWNPTTGIKLSEEKNTAAKEDSPPSNIQVYILLPASKQHLSAQDGLRTLWSNYLLTNIMASFIKVAQANRSEIGEGSRDIEVVGVLGYHWSPPAPTLDFNQSTSITNMGGKAPREGREYWLAPFQVLHNMDPLHSRNQGCEGTGWCHPSKTVIRWWQGSPEES